MRVLDKENFGDDRYDRAIVDNSNIHYRPYVMLYILIFWGFELVVVNSKFTTGLLDNFQIANKGWVMILSALVVIMNIKNTNHLYLNHFP